MPGKFGTGTQLGPLCIGIGGDPERAELDPPCAARRRSWGWSGGGDWPSNRHRARGRGWHGGALGLAHCIGGRRHAGPRTGGTVAGAALPLGT